MDIQITDLAKQKILETAKEKKVEPIVRIYIKSFACSGARFGIAFDEAKQFDILTEIDGIEIVTNADYVPKHSDGLNIDYVMSPKEGYVITSLRPIKKNCGSGCDGCKH